MKAIFILILIISNAYAFLDDKALTTLQTLDHWNTFRIVLPHTATECFYLEAKLNDTIHVIYQVLRGGDNNIRLAITDPLDSIAFSRGDSPFGWYNDEHLKVAGTYRMCFKNEQYFTTKLLYIAVLAIHHDLLAEANIYAVDEKKNNDSALVTEFSINMMELLNGMSWTLYTVTAYQTVGRVQHMHDLIAVEGNASYVQNRALFQMLAMTLCSIVQVCSIRRLFKNSTSKKVSA